MRNALAVMAVLLSTYGASAETTTRTSVCETVPHIAFVLGDQRLITMDVSREQIRETPPWDLEAGKEPPLSVEDAVRVATAEFGRTVPNPESWRLFRINVDVLCEKRAAYEVWWSEQGVRRGFRGNLPVPVLMSGAALSTSSAVGAPKASEPVAATLPVNAEDFKKECANGSFKSYFSLESLTVEVEIPLAGLESSPPWTPEDFQKPPLSPGEAVRLARSELRRVVKDEADWYVVSLSIMRTMCAQRAYYEIGWQSFVNGRTSNITIPVLMSGEVVATGRAIKEARQRASTGSGLR